MREFSFVIPVYNEENVIESNIEKIIKKLRESKFDFELIIADDGSTDSTPQKADALEKKWKEAKAFHAEKNMGKGEVLSKAFHITEGKYIAFMDIDLATDLKHVDDLRKSLAYADICTASRWIKGAHVKRGMSRWVISFCYNLIIRTLFHLKIHDHQCGFKGFRRDIAIRLADECGIRNNRSWAWDTEMLVRAQKHGFKIVEFPVKWNAGKQTKFRFFRDAYMVGTYLLGLYFSLKKGDKNENSSGKTAL